LTAFSFWDAEGVSLYKGFFEGGLTLDGVKYHCITTEDITQGWVSADVKIVTPDGEDIVTMYGGSVGMKFESSGNHEEELDKVNPMSGWWVYEILKEGSCK
jgi:hypothetical protein